MTFSLAGGQNATPQSGPTLALRVVSLQRTAPERRQRGRCIDYLGRINSPAQPFALLFEYVWLCWPSCPPPM
ncbi:hypothetical protein AB205_0184230 [Aquarana catesbeiana]|uniref:Uncharacterized protein n=1 Tax=Aquarana catesbeiana TaxID=8400 RepID=A0A2G9RFY1_AQUCT|nr:hypothetical protein AB205_0184230 [Aquarana catesbeiana]